MVERHSTCRLSQGSTEQEKFGSQVVPKGGSSSTSVPGYGPFFFLQFSANRVVASYTAQKGSIIFVSKSDGLHSQSLVAPEFRLALTGHPAADSESHRQWPMGLRTQQKLCN